MATVQLDYSVDAVGLPVTVAQVTAVMAPGALPLVDPGQLTLLGVSLLSDAVAAAGTVVTRTVIFTLLPAFLSRFPNLGTQTAAVTNFYTGVIAMRVCARVTATVPVFA